MPKLRPVLLTPGLLVLVALAAPAGDRTTADLPADPLPAPLPVERPLGLRLGEEAGDGDAALIALGRQLFFTGDLSPERTASCATCHRPEQGFAENARFSIGHAGVATRRNTPTLLNRGIGRAFMWDGAAASLEEQVLMPIENGDELGLGVEAAVARLGADEEWSAAFAEGLGELPSAAGLARALAAFVGVLRLGNSPLDHFKAGDAGHMTPDEISGMWFFESRGGCWRCHSGPNFSDDRFHNTGVGAFGGRPESGRFGVTGVESDRGAFKTPTLRGLARTAPYMHDGSLAGLEEIVQFYREGGKPNSHLSSRIAPLEMSDEDARHLVAFLRVLSREVAPDEVAGPR